MINSFRYCFTREKAVDSRFLEYVTDLTASNQHLFKANPMGPARKSLKLEDAVPSGDRTLFNVKQALAEYYQLGEYSVPDLKDFIGYITEGGFIHPHRDPDGLGKTHVRVNVLISQTAGCVPLLDGIPITVSIGDAWLNLASRCLHASTPVEGIGYRSAISFGYLIDPERGSELYEVHKTWLHECNSNRMQ